MAARRGKVARRFSDTSLKVLVAAVRARARVLFPRSSKKVHGSLSKKAWLEVAEEVSRLSITPRTWIQCRKRFNDLTRSAREKAAHNVRERSRLGGGTTDVVALTPVEQSAMDICGTPREISIGDGEAGGFSKHGDCFTIVPLHTAQAIPVSIKTSPSWALALTRNQVTSNRSAITSENHLEEEEIHYTALNLSPTNRTRSAACQMVYAEVRQEALLKKNSLPTSCSSK